MLTRMAQIRSHSIPPRLGPQGVHLGLTAVVAYLVVAPLAMLVVASLKASHTALPFTVPGLSLANFREIISNPATGGILRNTALYVAGALGLVMGFTVALSYLLERTDLPGRHLLSILVLSPMAIPPLVMAMAWAFLANPANGPVAQWLHSWLGPTVNIYSIGGMIWVTALVAVPSQYLLISPQMAQLDPTLEDAAAVSGARFRHRLGHITLGLLRPALLAAAMLFVVVAVELFDIPALLGFPRGLFVFSTLIQQALEPPTGVPNYGLASSYGVLLLMVAGGLVAIYRHLMGAENRFRTVTGKGYRPHQVALGRWRWLGAAAVWGYFAVAVALPVAVLLWASFTPYYAGPSWTLLHRLTLQNYWTLFQYPGLAAAVWHTALIVLVSSTATILLGTWAAWVSVRRRFTGSWAPVELGFLVLGVPGVVMGMSLGYLYLVVPIPIYGTVWIIVVAYITRFLAYAVRLMDSAFRQLDRELEEAGSLCGASTGVVVRRVVVPLLLPAMGRGWLWVAVHAMSELPMALLLQTTANQTVAVALWNLWTAEGNFSLASALAVLLTATSALLTGITWRWTSQREEAVVI